MPVVVQLQQGVTLAKRQLQRRWMFGKPRRDPNFRDGLGRTNLTPVSGGMRTSFCSERLNDLL